MSAVAMETRIGIIGGSGLEDIAGLNIREELQVLTPYGNPSDYYRIGEIGGVGVAFLNRHGRGHHLSPSNLPNRANIWGFKALGVERLVAVSAVGSLQEEIEPGHLVVPDQLIDNTSSRIKTFFTDRGIVPHASLAEPYCGELRDKVIDASLEADTTVHPRGTLMVMEGPQFSTRAESRMYRILGADIIGMTAMPEAGLAREAGMCYSTLALSTDFDSWRETDEVVTGDMVAQTVRANIGHANAVLGELVPKLGEMGRSCDCSHALDYAVMSANSNAVPRVLQDRFAMLTGRMPFDDNQIMPVQH